MKTCGTCNFYCTGKRICILDEEFYFEGFPPCERYVQNKEIEAEAEKEDF